MVEQSPKILSSEKKPPPLFITSVYMADIHMMLVEYQKRSVLDSFSCLYFDQNCTNLNN